MHRLPSPWHHVVFSSQHCTHTSSCVPPCAAQAVKECFVGAKDAGFKVVCHMMPDLPNVGWERDLECFREFFESPEFRWGPG